MKTLEKREMVERNKVMRVLTEERILGAVDHPFLAHLYATIQTDTHLHFLMQARPPATIAPDSAVLMWGSDDDDDVAIVHIQRRASAAVQSVH